jgi:hypothetical protein
VEENAFILSLINGKRLEILEDLGHNSRKLAFSPQQPFRRAFKHPLPPQPRFRLGYNQILEHLGHNCLKYVFSPQLKDPLSSQQHLRRAPHGI